MGVQFRDWLSCPDCGERDDAQMMANKTDIVVECYNCGQIAEYTIGDDIPLHNLDIEAITDIVSED